MDEIKTQNINEVQSMFDQSFGLNDNPFDDMRYKFIARASNRIDRMIQNILIEQQIDLPICFLNNPDDVPFYLVGPDRYTICKSTEELLIRLNG